MCDGSDCGLICLDTHSDCKTHQLRCTARNIRRIESAVIARKAATLRDREAAWLDCVEERCVRIGMTHRTDISPSIWLRAFPRHFCHLSIMCLKLIAKLLVENSGNIKCFFFVKASTKLIAKLFAQLICVFPVLVPTHTHFEELKVVSMTRSEKQMTQRFVKPWSIKNAAVGACEQSSCTADPNSRSTGPKWKTWLS